jgi:hypothetical protein
MLIAAVAMAALLGGTPDDSPAELVARLGSPRFAEREAAAESLRRLGHRALPALREARLGRDLEIRLRASHLRDEIEASTILKPTMVRLDFHDRPLSEVVEGIGRRAGASLASGDEPFTTRKPQDRPSWPDRRITLEAPEPLPFWEALDRLCRAGGLRRRHPLSPYELADRPILVPGEAWPPKSDTGSFRVELLRIRRERDLDLTPGLSELGRAPRAFGPSSRPAGPGYGPEVKEVRTSSFFAELLISTEPRLRIVGEASLERLEASDGQGHSILRDPTPEQRNAELAMFRMNPHLDPRLHPELGFGSVSRTSSPVQLRSIPLADSTPPGLRLAVLKGVAVVAVMARRADPLVVPLAEAKAKTITIENDGVRLTIHEAIVKPNHYNGELELSLETEKPAETLSVHGPGIGLLEITRPIDLNQREIEIVDDEDRPIEWSFLQPPTQGVRGRMRLYVRPRNQGDRVDFSKLRLRVFTMVGAAIELPFSFTDVPMP